MLQTSEEAAPARGRTSLAPRSAAQNGGADPGSALARRLLPILLLTTALFAWLRLEGQRAGLYGTELGVFLMVALQVLALLVVVAWTVRSLRRAERARARAARAFELHADIVANVQVALIVGRLEVPDDPGSFRLIAFNPAAASATGIELEPLLGRSLTQTFPAALDTGVPAACADVVRSGAARDFGELRHGDGTRERVFFIKAFPLPEACVGLAFEDVTERKRAERALVRAKEIAELARQELESFSYSVSHDLRAPLRGIDGFSQALLEDYGESLDAQGQDFLRRIRAATQRMGHLIDDMLELARVARADVNRRPLDLSAIASRISTELSAAEPQRQVEFAIAQDAAAEADPRLVEIALQNLLSNAWKFTSQRPRARIEFGRLDSPEGPPIFFVRDDGAGFDEEHAGKLFGAFQRLHSAREFPGNGVGLATVRRVVARHGGRVWAEGRVGEGATFFFTLEGEGDSPETPGEP